MSKEKGKVVVKTKKKSEAVKRLTRQLKELEGLEEMESLIKNNVIDFQFEKVNYRLRRPTPQEKREVSKKRTKKYTDLLREDEYMLREQLIELYEKKGISIRKLELEIIELQKQHESLLLKLAQCKIEADIKKLKEEIIDVREQTSDIFVKKSGLLQYSLEEALLEFVNTYFAYLVLEKKKKNNWVRVFKTYEELMDCENNELLTRVYYFLSILISQEEII